MTHRLSYLAITAAAVLSLAMPASADKDKRHMDERPSDMPVAGSFHTVPNFTAPRFISRPVQLAAVAVSPGQAKSIAMRAHRGAEYLDIRLVGGKTYIVRLMKSGQRFDVRVDARTGRIVG